MRTRRITVGNVPLGGGAPVAIQSMCDTPTEDVRATVSQIKRLEEAGCEIVRVTVNTAAAALALRDIKRETRIPVVADVHYDWKLAIAAAENGADKIRINPGNIGGRDRVRYLADFLKERGLPVRVGVNEGSLEKDLRASDPADALVESALREIRILEDAGFYDTVVSLKSSDVLTAVRACRKFSSLADYPLHIGATEAGTLRRGLVKNAAVCGILLSEGIGDTVRFSLSSDPAEEVRAADMLLTALGLRGGCQVTACPACGRAGIPVHEIAEETERLLIGKKGLRISVTGCAVNGPGEAAKADLGIAGGREKSALYLNGKFTKTIENKDVLAEIKSFIDGSGGEK